MDGQVISKGVKARRGVRDGVFQKPEQRVEFNLSAIPRLSKYGDGAEFELEGLFMAADAIVPLPFPPRTKRGRMRFRPFCPARLCL